MPRNSKGAPTSPHNLPGCHSCSSSAPCLVLLQSAPQTSHLGRSHHSPSPSLCSGISHFISYPLLDAVVVPSGPCPCPSRSPSIRTPNITSEDPTALPLHVERNISNGLYIGRKEEGEEKQGDEEKEEEEEAMVVRMDGDVDGGDGGGPSHSPPCPSRSCPQLKHHLGRPYHSPSLCSCISHLIS